MSRRKEKRSVMFSTFFLSPHDFTLDRSTYRGVDSVVLCEGDTCSEERGKDSSEKHCVLVVVVVKSSK
jgi:hypothetical protein